MRNSTIQPPLGTPLNISHSLSQGLASSWLMNEGGGLKIFDGTGLNNVPGALTNGAVFKQTIKGNGILFDGVNDYIDAGLGSSLLPGTGNFTISLWIWAANANQGACLLQKRSAATTPLYSVSVDDNVDSFSSGKRIGVNFSAVGSNSRTVDTTANVIDGNWHHIVATWTLTGNVILIYIDGVSVALTARTTVGTITSMSPNTSLKIGSNTGSAFFFNGLISNVKMWQRALSASDAMRLYTSPFSMYIGKVR